MNARSARLLAIGRLLIFAGCAACGDRIATAGPPIPLNSITIAPSNEILMLVGGQVQLSVVARDAHGNVIVSPLGVAFVSRDTSRVTVDSKGLVTAIAVGRPTYVVATLLDARLLADSVAVTALMLTDRVPTTAPVPALGDAVTARPALVQSIRPAHHDHPYDQ